jgi:sugar lactone lactonase YvrE
VETATFNTPTGVCALRDGSLLVADSKNNAIRRVGTRPGRRELYVTTIVGGATAGFVDGDAVHARLNNPTSVAVDRHGTVIVVDTGNHAIRALHPPSGSNSRHGDAAHGWIVTTIAGGPQAGHTDGASAAALFRSPAAVSFMDDGRMLVADSGNNCVRCLRPGGLLSRRRGPAGELPVAPQGAGLGGASSDASSTTRGRMTVRGDVVDVIEEQQARAEYQALAFQELVQQQERERQRQLSGGGPASPTRQAAGSLSTHAPGVSEAYPSPGDIILAHRRYAYVSTVAGPRSPLTSSSPASRDVNAAKVAVVPRDGRYRDGYFCDARMRGPAGVCALPHSGGIVLVADGLNHFLRMLVPRAAIARPVATLRHLLPKTLLQYASNRSPADIAADAALGQGRVSDSSVASSAHAVRR